MAAKAQFVCLVRYSTRRKARGSCPYTASLHFAQSLNSSQDLPGLLHHQTSIKSGPYYQSRTYSRTPFEMPRHLSRLYSGSL